MKTLWVVEYERADKKVSSETAVILTFGELLMKLMRQTRMTSAVLKTLLMMIFGDHAREVVKHDLLGL